VKKEESNMKRKAIPILLISTVLIFLFGGTPAKVSAKAVELSFSNHLPAVHPYVKEVFEPWAAEIEKRTNGRYKVNVFSSETLAKARDQYDMLLKGGIDITFVVGTHYPGRFPMFDVASLPFTLPHGAKAKDGELIRNKIMNKYIIPAHFKDVQVMWTSRYAPTVIQMVKKPIRVKEDLKGLIIGNPGGPITSTAMKLLGATSERVATPDVYNALERGMVDGQILPLETAVSHKFYEVVKWITMANFGASVNLVCMNKKKWDRISAADQKIFVELFDWAEKKMDAVTMKAIDNAKKVLTDKGIELIELTPAELTRWKEACKDVESNWVAQMEEKKLPAKAMVNEIHALLGN
jgi:TRAP-type C4-dicarboxylate transport system substrate-binding protein